MRYFRIKTGESTEYADDMNDKAYQLWKKLMKLGEKTGCHQKADRSFYFKGYQLPVCARCTGVIIGYLAAIPAFFLIGFSGLVSAVGAFILFLDWFLQAAGLLKSTNQRRLVTGIAGGYGIMSLQLHLIKKIIKYLLKTK